MNKENANKLLSTNEKSNVWSIRGVSSVAKGLAFNKSKEEKITVAKWVELAILEKIKNDKDNNKENKKNRKRLKKIKKDEINNTLLENFFSLLQKMNSSGVKADKELTIKINDLMNKFAKKIQKGKKINLTEQQLILLKDEPPIEENDENIFETFEE